MEKDIVRLVPDTESEELMRKYLLSEMLACRKKLEGGTVVMPPLSHSRRVSQSM